MQEASSKAGNAMEHKPFSSSKNALLLVHISTKKHHPYHTSKNKQQSSRGLQTATVNGVDTPSVDVTVNKIVFHTVTPQDSQSQTSNPPTGFCQ